MKHTTTGSRMLHATNMDVLRLDKQPICHATNMDVLRLDKPFR